MIKESSIKIITICIFLLILSCSGNSSGDEYMGVWQFTVKNTPNGDITGVMTLGKSGQEYSGKLSSYQGSTDLTDISFQNNKIKCGFYMGDNYLSISGKFDEDTFEGIVESETESFPMQAIRQ